MRTSCDFLIIGGGIIGINLALRVKKRYADCKVMLVDKEKDCGYHASGRNSGVLHAGFYYTEDSLKARFTVEGNRQLTEYCEANALPINKCGKLVVAKNESEVPVLDTLLQRGRNNKVILKEVAESEAKEIEPRVKTVCKALWSPTTSSIDPRQVVASLIRDARAENILIQNETAYLDHQKEVVSTSRGKISAGYVINAAGLYADKIARDYGFSRSHCIIPFKGLYLIGTPGLYPLRTNIYPVPDLKNPFLGVHFTITVDGKVKIGPTAIPAFWREHYHGFSNFNFSEMTEILGQEIKLFIANTSGFRKLATKELLKYRKLYMLKLAGELADGVRKEMFTRRGPSGIRAQLFNLKTRRLEMDFHYEGDSYSFHVLNAVSPAFTCSMPFTDFLVDQIAGLV